MQIPGMPTHTNLARVRPFESQWPCTTALKFLKVPSRPDHVKIARFAAVVPVAVAMMTPIPLLAALAIQKVRSLLGYQTKGRCPVAVTGEPVEMDMKDSESKQRLVRDPETNCAEAMGINDDLNNEKPIVKSANGCPMKGTT